MGRAHHRAIYLLVVTLASLSATLGILNITKQSLSRVLSGLMKEGFVLQNWRKTVASGYYLTETGVEFEG